MAANNPNAKSDNLKTKFVPTFMTHVNNVSVQGQRLLKYKLKRIKKVTPEELKQQVPDATALKNQAAAKEEGEQQQPAAKIEGEAPK